MVVKQRPQWTAVEVAAHAMEATSLSQLTLPEVKRMAARILADAQAAAEPNRTAPQPVAETNIRQIPDAEFKEGWSQALKLLE